MTDEEYASLNQKLTTLLSKCARSDEKAFSDVYNLTSSSLFAVLVRCLGMNATAEKALHDTFVKIWSNANDYSVELGSPMTWLTSIARGQALEVLRNSHPQDNPGVTLSGIKSMPAELAQITLSHKNQADQILEDCLNELDDQTRDCLVRTYTEALSLDQLSELHDLPAVALQSKVRHGLLSLQGCINESA